MSEPAPAAAERPARRSKPRSWLELPMLILLTLLVAALIRTFLVQPFFIPSGSMENTLQTGDRVVVDKVSYRFRDISRGDIVVFNGLDSFTPEVEVEEPPNAFLRGMRAVGAAVGVAPPGEKDFIKRVIGIPGDRVRCCDAQGRVTVNGRALDESEYLHPGDQPSDTPFDVTVPPGRLWVMGDHRAASADSRAHTGDPGGGTVPENKVIGRAFSVVWPPSRMSGLGRPEAFEQVGQRRESLREPQAQSLGTSPEAASSYALALGSVSPSVVGRPQPGSGTEGLRR